MKLRFFIAALSLTLLGACAGVEQSGGKREVTASAAPDACSGLRPASSCYCRMAKIRCQ
jgi:hypothetical protein